MSWIVDRKEYAITHLETRGGNNPFWVNTGVNLLGNTVFSESSDPENRPRIISYSINGDVTNNDDPGPYGPPYEPISRKHNGIEVVVEGGSIIWVTSHSPRTEPVVVDYVIQHGDTLLNSQAIFANRYPIRGRRLRAWRWNIPATTRKAFPARRLN